MCEHTELTQPSISSQFPCNANCVWPWDQFPFVCITYTVNHTCMCKQAHMRVHTHTHTHTHRGAERESGHKQKSNWLLGLYILVWKTLNGVNLEEMKRKKKKSYTLITSPTQWSHVIYIQLQIMEEETFVHQYVYTQVCSVKWLHYAAETNVEQRKHRQSVSEWDIPAVILSDWF